MIGTRRAAITPPGPPPTEQQDLIRLIFTTPNPVDKRFEQMEAKMAGMLKALNNAFAKNVERLMTKHPSVSWGAAIADYLMYVEQLEQKY